MAVLAACAPLRLVMLVVVTLMVLPVPVGVPRLGHALATWVALFAGGGTDGSFARATGFLCDHIKDSPALVLVPSVETATGQQLGVADVVLGLRRLVDAEIAAHPAPAPFPSLAEVALLLGSLERTVATCLVQQSILVMSMQQSGDGAGLESPGAVLVRADGSVQFVLRNSDSSAPLVDHAAGAGEGETNELECAGRVWSSDDWMEGLQTEPVVCVTVAVFVRALTRSQPQLLQRLLFETWNLQQSLPLLRASVQLGFSASRALVESLETHLGAARGVVASLLFAASAGSLLGFDPRESSPLRLCAPNGGRPCPAAVFRWALALSTVFACDELGLTPQFPVDLWDVLRWYPPTVSPVLLDGDGPDPALLVHAVYAVTHLVYVLSGYSAVAVLDPCWLPSEFAFLARAVPALQGATETDALGECVDALKLFLRACTGATGEQHGQPHAACQCPQLVAGTSVPATARAVREAEQWLLREQAGDGSWSPRGASGGERVHSTFAVSWALRGAVVSTDFPERPALVFADVQDVLVAHPSFRGFDFASIRRR